MSAIVTADTHWEHRPRDEYRWKLFPWLAEQAADDIVFCGDLTGPKDGHPSQLVNRLADGMAALAAKSRIWIVAGNHDAIDPTTPFFRFLRNTPNITFALTSKLVDMSIGRALLMPVGSKWDGVHMLTAPCVFTHATFKGSLAENGQVMTGVDPAVLGGYNGVVYAGDIHVPQLASKRPRIVSIGAPYHIKFGDAFTPRIIRLADDGTAKDLHFPAPRKLVLSITEPFELLDESSPRAGDQVKVRCYLRRRDYARWRVYRADIAGIAAERGWLLCGVKLVASETDHAKVDPSDDDQPSAAYKAPQELIEAFVRRKKVGEEYLAVGEQLIKSAAQKPGR